MTYTAANLKLIEAKFEYLISILVENLHTFPFNQFESDYNVSIRCFARTKLSYPVTHGKVYERKGLDWHKQGKRYRIAQHQNSVRHLNNEWTQWAIVIYIQLPILLTLLWKYRTEIA
jgi:hypothetical protein